MKAWFRFQRLYDVARSVLRTEDDVRRLVREAAEGRRARRRALARNPSTRPAMPRGSGGITHFTDLVLDCVRDASERTGLGIAVVVTDQPHPSPLDARTLARLAAQYADRGVVGFGLSNDERRGTTTDFARLRHRPPGPVALVLAPGEPWVLSPWVCLDALHADRLGHGVRAPGTRPAGARGGRRCGAGGMPGLQRLAGVYQRSRVRAGAELLAAGATIALGSDDPLLFGTRLAGQYATVRARATISTTRRLAQLARSSFEASRP